MSLQLSVARSSLKIIAGLGQAGQLDTLGISEADYKRLTASGPWMPAEKNRMTSVLHSLIMGSVDAMGLPRFHVPAEYMAAAIVVFVHPVNMHAACNCAPSTGEADAMSRGDLSNNVRPEQLFSLCAALYDSSDRSDARASFERSVGLAIEAAELIGSSAEGAPAPKVRPR